MLHKIITKIVSGGRATGKIHQYLTHEATLEQVVGTMYLRIGLLKEHHPQLIVVASCENGLTAWLAGEQVVNSHLLPMAILAQAEAIEAIVAVLLRHEKALYQRWPLGQDGERGEEVTIVEHTVLAAVLHIRWLDRIVEYVDIVVKESALRDALELWTVIAYSTEGHLWLDDVLLSSLHRIQVAQFVQEFVWSSPVNRNVKGPLRIYVIIYGKVAGWEFQVKVLLDICLQ